MDVEKIAERVAEASAALSAEEVLSRVEESTRTSAEELAEFAGILGEWKIAPAAVDLMIDTMTKHGLDFVRQILKGMAAKQAKKNAASRKRASGDLLGALEEDFAASG